MYTYQFAQDNDGKSQFVDHYQLLNLDDAMALLRRQKLIHVDIDRITDVTILTSIDIGTYATVQKLL